jgi:hypothetical protein
MDEEVALVAPIEVIEPDEVYQVAKGAAPNQLGRQGSKGFWKITGL